MIAVDIRKEAALPTVGSGRAETIELEPIDRWGDQLEGGLTKSFLVAVPYVAKVVHFSLNRTRLKPVVGRPRFWPARSPVKEKRPNKIPEVGA